MACLVGPDSTMPVGVICRACLGDLATVSFPRSEMLTVVNA